MKREMLLNELAAMIVAIRTDHPVTVAIDGVDGVGKTTLADELVEPLRELGRRVIRGSLDGFHNPVSTRYREGPLSARGYFLDSFNYGALKINLLNPLGPNGSREYRTKVFDQRTDSEVVGPYARADVSDIPFDGVFLQRKELQRCWDFVVWLEASFETTARRAIAREAPDGTDSLALAQRYAKRYVPGQRIYFDECQPRANANVVVNNEDWSNPEVRGASANRLTKRCE